MEGVRPNHNHLNALRGEDEETRGREKRRKTEEKASRSKDGGKEKTREREDEGDEAEDGGKRRKRGEESGSSKEGGNEEAEVRDEEMAEEEGEEVEAGEEEPEVKIAAKPVEPSREEKEKHNATHAVYRSWCPHCVRGRGLASPHKSDARSRNPTTVPEVVMDYCFLSQADESSATVLAIRDRSTGATAAMVVPMKGHDEWIVKTIVGIIDWFGHGKMLMKTDGKRSITSLKQAVKIYRESITVVEGIDGELVQRKTGETICEESPKGESSSNGAAEKLVQEVEGMVRTWKDAVETS